MFEIYFYLFCYCSDYCSNVGRIIVKGYDAKLPHDDVESALRKLFSSCGEINDIFISETEDRLYRFVAFFMFSQLNPIRSITTCQRKTFFFFFAFAVMLRFISSEKVQQKRRCNLVEVTLEDGRPLLRLILFRKLQAGT